MLIKNGSFSKRSLESAMRYIVMARGSKVFVSGERQHVALVLKNFVWKKTRRPEMYTQCEKIVYRAS